MDDAVAQGTTDGAPHAGRAPVPGGTPSPRRGGLLRYAARHRGTTAVAVVLLAVGLVGCGGSSDASDDDGGAKFTSKDARDADEAVKLSARELSETIESCFDATRDYARCTTNRELGATRASLVRSRPAAGEATITRATTTGYRVLVVSYSESRFAITRQAGQLIRSCAVKTPLARAGGGCNDNRW